MTYPDSGRPENPPSFPVLEPYDLHPEQVAQTVAQPVGQPPQATPAGGFAQPGPLGQAGGQTTFTPTGFDPTATSPTPAPAAAPRKKTGLIVLSIIAVLFFATAGVFGVLYANESSRNDRLTGRVADQEKQLSDSAKQLKDAKDETTKAKDAQKSAETARKRAEDDSASAAKCRDAARSLREAIIANDDGKADQAVRDLFGIC
ncbi:hypothetical protein [Saccharothrix variisporea]|uniref:Uncharacterized protein n=1 Tax=Saccharothrix variisporea TaxID=543527 RepID=A0A495XG16_9PSEU|nr:hypothetical protein [Saccharothrix variisporea]RKT73401.1 hypothetical protein DFJ66_6734 [Saccharothrix variisporea]